MKPFYYYLPLFLFFSIHLEAQDCEIPDALLQHYQEDISHLAILHLETTNAPEANDAIIPEATLTKFWSDLSAIFNSDLPERDEVFDAHCIHHQTSASKVNYRLYVNVNENASWYQNWMNNDISTGIEEIDNFLARYNFQLDGTLGSTFKIKTDEIYNLQPLADTISAFDGVNFSEIISGIGDGNRIVHSIEEGKDLYHFYLHWGDCPAGCIWWYSWTFQVENDCTVSFLGNDWNNSDFPEPINCNITTITSVSTIAEAVNISLLPNPSSDYISINVLAENNERQKFQIFNMLGNQVSSGQITNQLLLDIHDWENGIYFLRIDSQKQAFKFLKL